MRTAVLLINGLGDQLIAWPTLRALRQALPGEMELWVGLGMYRSLYHDVAMTGWCIPHVGTTLRQLDVSIVKDDHPRVDLFVSICTWWNPTVQAFVERLGAPRSVGLWGEHDETLRPPVGHMFDIIFTMARHFDSRLVLEDFAAPPSFSGAAECAARRFVAEHLAPGERMLFVHPDTRPDKMWTAAGWSRALHDILEACPDLKIFLTSQSVPFTPELGRHQHRLVALDTPFEMTLAILRYASAFIGVDSSLLHGADLLRIPSVGLFGPTDPAQWGFRLTPCHRLLHTKGAPLSALEPKAVVDALREVLA